MILARSSMRLASRSLTLFGLIATIELSLSSKDNDGGWRKTDIGCKNEAGHPVDWWFIYKLPNGFDYAYWDINTPSHATLMPEQGRSLNCTRNCSLGDTLHQIYVNKTGLASVLYNDEPPSTMASLSMGNAYPSTETAHAKGVLAYDGVGAGFWLIHSVPKFPDLTLPSFTWTASSTYGQSFFCMSLDAQTIDIAAFQLRHTYAEIFSAIAPEWLPRMSPNMSLLSKGVLAKSANTSVGNILTRGGTSVDHFAKSAEWGKDLYEDFVELHYGTGFMWETWRRKPYTEPSYCHTNGSKYDSVNVMSIQFGEGDEHELAFHYTRDHCKWGISLSGETVCIGDINRMTSQKKRGGGTACINNTRLWHAIRSVINSTDSCVPH